MPYRIQQIIQRQRVIVGLLIGLVTLLAQALGSGSAFAAACSTPSPSYGTDSMSLSIPATSTYRLWVRLLSPSSGNNAVLLQVDSGACYTMGGSSSIPVNAWTWVDYQNGNTGAPITLSLSQGNHSIELLGNQPGVEVDRIEALSDGSCVPSGTGNNCTSASSSAPSPAPAPSPSSQPSTPAPSSYSGGGTASSSSPSAASQGSSNTLLVNGPVAIRPTISKTPGASPVKAQYYLNGKLLATQTTPPFVYNLQPENILNGTYTLTATVTYSSGQTTTDSWQVIINNPPSPEQVWLRTQAYVARPIVKIPGIVLLLMIVLLIVRHIVRRIRRSRSRAQLAANPAAAQPLTQQSANTPYPWLPPQSTVTPTPQVPPVQPTPPSPNGQEDRKV